MRTAQIGLFVVGVASFVGAIFGIGETLGDILWRLGIAIMLTDLCMIKLWPNRSDS